MNTTTNTEPSRVNFTGLLMLHLVVVVGLVVAFRSGALALTDNWISWLIGIGAVVGALAWASIGFSLVRRHPPLLMVTGSVLLAASTAAWGAGEVTSSLHNVLVWSGISGMLIGALVFYTGVRQRASLAH